MGRPIRQFFKGGIWHILNRGVAKADIFHCKEDYVFYMYKINEALKKYPVGIHAFNLLSNHIHYLLEQTLDEVSPSKFIASIHTSLGHYTNRKYSRVGHLFQDRCKVKDIKEDEHLLAVSVYINLNKILERLEHLERLSISKDKLEGLFLEAEKDPWSSYPVYLGLRRDGITKTDFILSLICDNMKKAQKEYKKFAKHLVTSGYFIKTRDLVFE
jgi:REP element-mobilizing transposase RayT